jgi:hypothetical protein
MSNRVPGEQQFSSQSGETVGDALLRETVIEKTLLSRETILFTLECMDALDYADAFYTASAQH